jgi:predicted DNA-binding WGR domain protein
LIKAYNLPLGIIAFYVVDIDDIAAVKAFESLTLIRYGKIGERGGENKFAFFRMDEYCILIIREIQYFFL